MKATEFIAAALEGGRMWMEALLKDVDGADVVAVPTPNGGNHPLWVIGHLAASEASMLDKLIKGAGEGIAEWEELFGMGSQPVADASKYPTKAALLARLRQVREQTLAHLRTLSDADLDKKSHAKEYPEMFGTIGLCFALMINHQTFHVGQIADVRRALGRRPVFA